MSYHAPQSQEEFRAAIEAEEAKLSHLRLVTKKAAESTPTPTEDRDPPDDPPIRPSLREIYSGAGYAPEVISYVTAIMWGFWVGNPFFSVYAHGGLIYDGPKHFGPEELWGGFVLVGGLLGMWGLFEGYRAMRSLGTSMLMSVWAWGFIAAISGPSLWTTAPVAYPVLAMVAAWAHSLLSHK